MHPLIRGHPRYAWPSKNPKNNNHKCNPNWSLCEKRVCCLSILQSWNTINTDVIRTWTFPWNQKKCRKLWKRGGRSSVTTVTIGHLEAPQKSIPWKCTRLFCLPSEFPFKTHRHIYRSISWLCCEKCTGGLCSPNVNYYVRKCRMVLLQTCNCSIKTANGTITTVMLSL